MNLCFIIILCRAALMHCVALKSCRGLRRSAHTLIWVQTSNVEVVVVKSMGKEMTCIVHCLVSSKIHIFVVDSGWQGLKKVKRSHEAEI